VPPSTMARPVRTCDGVSGRPCAQTWLRAASIHNVFTDLSQTSPQGKRKNRRKRSSRRGLSLSREALLFGLYPVQIKGTKSGLLLHLYERPLVDVVGELRLRLGATPDFYKGSRAVLMLGALPADAAELAAIVATLEQFGIVADGAVCDSDSVASLARSAGLRLVAASVAAAPRSRDDRTGPEGPGASRRTSASRAARAGANGRATADTGVHYHKGTLRSGQSISTVGSIVVLGDVNAGAELVATGDIVVWGALRGVAHAGAQGDDQAAVYALRLEPMQLRISRCIAIAPPHEKRAKRVTPEVARIRDGKISIELAT
jgi:septum site-determining protein MinC